MRYSEREAKRNGRKYTVVALWEDGPVAEAWYDRKSLSRYRDSGSVKQEALPF